MSAYFSERSFKFLRSLARNNEREWCAWRYFRALHW